MAEYTADQLEAALDACNDEQVHIPGIVQSCGALIGVDGDTMTISYVSANADTYLQRPAMDLLGKHLSDLFDAEMYHTLSNKLAQLAFTPTRLSMGRTVVSEQVLQVSVSASAGNYVVEVEPAFQEDDVADLDMVALSGMMKRIEKAQTAQGLLDMLVQVLGLVSEYDRIKVYQFDTQFNGEVIAEQCSPGLEPFLGLRFPHWDIPPVAREMMKRFPIRFIADVESEPVPVLAAHVDLPDLDMTYAQLRGTSKIHLQYLTNMGISATMTMSLMVSDELWGIISFHNKAAKVPSVAVRQICEALVPMINAKLDALEKSRALGLNNRIEFLRAEFEQQALPGKLVPQAASELTADLMGALNVEGMMMRLKNDEAIMGIAPPKEVIQQLQEKCSAAEDGKWQSENLAEDLGVSRDALNDICGALCILKPDGRWSALFRCEASKGVDWAGAPQKELEIVDGNARLNPRGSFQTYKETVKNRAKAWKREDIQLLDGLAQSLLAANQRTLVFSALRRQQDLVVDELNHRVRNILSLVRSISRQARRHNSSLDSYSNALEQRMNALAVAHDLGTGKDPRPVSIAEMVRLEAEPFSEGRPNAVSIIGPEIGVTAEAAPIIALVLHELMTNAAKYGALSKAQGNIIINVVTSEAEALLTWIELGGPAVTEPSETGFGTTLIQQAIPYELGGHSQINFAPTGLTVTIGLPNSVFTEDLILDRDKEASRKTVPLPDMSGTNKLILIVEDNFMIATDLSANLQMIGYDQAELANSVPDAREIMTRNEIAFAILDINLGRNGTSVPLALDLMKADVPFFFVSGYGDNAPLPEELKDHLMLQRPLSLADLEGAIGEVFKTMALD